MKTAPFDLELAKLGHPLITRGGKKVIDFHYFGILISNYPINCVVDIYSGLWGYTTKGEYSAAIPNHTRDLLLDLETPWERPFEFLEEVLVKDNEKAEWRSMGFVRTHKDKFIVRGPDGYLETVSFCKRPNPIVEEKTTLDVEIKVGGQPVSLEDFKKLVNKL